SESAPKNQHSKLTAKRPSGASLFKQTPPDLLVAMEIGMTTKSWRDVLPVHPAADLFPLMSEAELRELGEDIKKNGLQIPIVVQRDGDAFKLLDGRNRLDAMELVGVPFELVLNKRRRRLGLLTEDCGLSDYPIEIQFRTDPEDFVLSAN